MAGIAGSLLLVFPPMLSEEAATLRRSIARVSEVIEHAPIGAPDARAADDATSSALALVRAWVGRPGSLGALVEGVGGKGHGRGEAGGLPADA
jgi:hypothetical protein